MFFHLEVSALEGYDLIEALANNLGMPMSDFLQNLSRVHWRRSTEQRIDVFTDLAYVQTACFEGKFGKVFSPISPKQVHGTQWIQATKVVAAGNSGADAIYTEGNELIAVATADCLPLLYANPTSETAGAAHLGWRGLVGGIAATAPKESGFVSPQTRVALGPCIGLQSFEVGPEVLEKFRGKFQLQMKDDFWLGVSKGRDDRWQIDLQLFTVFELLQLGFVPDNIEVFQVDTVTQNNHWFSYRCESPTGRNLACIQLNK